MHRNIALPPLLAGLAVLLAALGVRLVDPAPLQALRGLVLAILSSPAAPSSAFAARPLEMLLALATGLAPVLLLARRDRKAAIRALMVGVLVIAGTTWSAHVRGVAVDPLFPALALGLAALAAALGLALDRHRAGRALAQTFAGTLARPQMTALRDAATPLPLDDVRRDVTVLHAACEVAPGVDLDLAAFNRILAPLAGRLREAGAYVSVAIDGSLTAIWNAPIDQPAHAALAGRAALGLRPLAEGLAARLSEGTAQPAFRLGIGVATGAVRTGRMGSAARPTYAVLGAPMQEAQRLQREALAFGMPILVSATCARAASELATLPLAPGSLILMGDEMVGRAREFRALKPLLAELEANIKIHAERDIAAILAELETRTWPALWPPLTPLLAHYRARAS